MNVVPDDNFEVLTHPCHRRLQYLNANYMKFQLENILLFVTMQQYLLLIEVSFLLIDFYRSNNEIYLLYKMFVQLKYLRFEFSFA